MVLPVATFLLILVLKPAASIALGMIVVACCPGGAMSNLLTYLSRGNVAASVALTATSSLLAAILGCPSCHQRFTFARFDLAVLKHYLQVDCRPVYCTKIASRLVRTYTDRHGLKDICKELLGVDLSKQQQSSDWGAKELSRDQLAYAASDVLYLHQLRAKLDVMLEREGRMALAEACFRFLPTRAALDISGWNEVDIFAH